MSDDTIQTAVGQAEVYAQRLAAVAKVYPDARHGRLWKDGPAVPYVEVTVERAAGLATGIEEHGGRLFPYVNSDGLRVFLDVSREAFAFAEVSVVLHRLPVETVRALVRLMGGRL